MKIVEFLLQKDIDENLDEDVIITLGNGISAYESVPTAIYCFLRALKDIPWIKVHTILVKIKSDEGVSGMSVQEILYRTK